MYRCIYMYTYVYIYTYMYRCIYMYTYVYIYTYMKRCIYIYTYIYTHIYTYMCVCVCVCVCVFVCIHIYMYMYMYIPKPPGAHHCQCRWVIETVHGTGVLHRRRWQRHWNALRSLQVSVKIMRARSLRSDGTTLTLRSSPPHSFQVATWRKWGWTQVFQPTTMRAYPPYQLLHLCLQERRRKGAKGREKGLNRMTKGWLWLNRMTVLNFRLI